MNPSTCRRLLQLDNAPQAAPLLSPTAAAAAFRRQLDSSIALTIVVLLTAFFFLALLTFYIRRSGAEEPAAGQEEGGGGGGGGGGSVKSLPLVAYARQQTMEECPICLGEFEEGETVKLIPYCGHVFHGHCVDTWLALHVTCPLCRSDQLFKKPDDGDHQT